MTLDKFIQEQELQHKRKVTIQNNLGVLKPLNDFKSLDECTADDIKQYIENYNIKFKKKYKRKPNIGNLYFIYNVIKKYYLWSGKPEVTKWMNIKNPLKPINPNKLLTPAEVQTIIRLCDNDRDKCLIAVGYESGMRIGELLSLRVEDIKIHDHEYQLRIPDNFEGEDVNSKTGSRTMTLIESLPYVEKYLSIHNGNDLLFDIGRNRAGDIIRNIAKKAGINKKVYFHLLRHTRATELTKLGMQETAMKKRLGWTGDSKMITRYTHITDSDSDDAYKTALGLGTKPRDIILNPIAKRCAKCGKLIDTGEYCLQCSEIQRLIELNEKTQIAKDNQETETELLKLKYEDASLKLNKLSNEITELSIFFGATKLILEGSKNNEITKNELITIIDSTKIDPKISIPIERAMKKTMLSTLQDLPAMTEAEQQELLKKYKEKGIDMNPNHMLSLTFTKEDFEKAPKLLKQIEEHKKLIKNEESKKDTP